MTQHPAVPAAPEETVGHWRAPVTGVFALLMLSACAAVGVRPDIPLSESVYRNAVHGWSVSYPLNWEVDDRDANAVKISSAPDAALCRMHSFPVPDTTTATVATVLTWNTRKQLESENKGYDILAQTEVSLPNGIVGIDSLAEIVPKGAALERSAAGRRQICPGCGKSRRIYVVAKGHAFVIDCATHWERWEQLEPVYDRIIRSFTLGR